MKIIPELIFKASANNKPVNAYRVYFIAKDYDRGNGFIPAKAFRRYMASLGIARPTLYRWLSQAFELGLMDYQGGVYSLVSWERAAALAGVEKIQRAVNIDLNRFIAKGWLAVVWGAFRKHFEGRLIARSSLERLTGVPARTQREYESKIEVKKKANIANFGDPSRDPENALFIDHKRGVYGKAGMTRGRLPDKVTVIEENIELANKGRTKKANRALRALLNTRCSSPKPEKLYFETYQQYKRATRGKQRDNAQNRPNHRYLFVTDALNIGVWDAI